LGTQQFLDDYDATSAAELTEPPRAHLGASQIGGRCAREAWLDFRWAGVENVGGQMRRLWRRGHDEEHNFVRWLRAMGIEVQDYSQRLTYHPESDSYACFDWATDWSQGEGATLMDVHDSPLHIAKASEMGDGPKQWKFSDHNGHYGGSGDGKLSGDDLSQWFPELMGKGLGALECKTSNDKNFKELKRKGVQQGKPVHYLQMQQYMRYLNCSWALYLVVNKNNDEIYAEVVQYRPEVADMYSERAGKIIESRQPPPKLTEDPSWFECRFCKHRGPCHYDEPLPQKNCRSCVFASAEEDKQWVCNLHRSTIPKNFIPKGCAKWEPCL